MEPTGSVEEKGEKAHAVGVGVRTVPELMDLTDLDPELWEAGKAEVKRWDSPYDGDLRSLWRIGCTFERRPPLESRYEEILDEIREESRVVPKRHEPVQSAEKYLLVLSPTDLHYGLRIAGADIHNPEYSPKEAERLAREGVAALLERVKGFPIAQILLPFGNDSAHVDNAELTTTAGTPQDTGALYTEIFRGARAVWAAIIRQCSMHAPTHVSGVAGNHDKYTTWNMIDVLAAQFAGDENVSFDTEADPYKFFQFGNTLIGLTHGKQPKHSKLPIVMAQEVPDLWAQTTYRTWLVGHKHRKSEEDIDGVTIKVAPSLAPADAWHKEQGYIHRRAIEAYLYEYAQAYVGTFSYGVY